jgi:hypothetical protein
MPWTVTAERAAELARTMPRPTPQQDAIATRLVLGADRPIYRAPSPYASVLVADILKDVKNHPPEALVGSGLRIRSLDHARAIAAGKFDFDGPEFWEPSKYVRPTGEIRYDRSYMWYRACYLYIAKQSGWEGEIPACVHLNCIGIADAGPDTGVLSDPPVESIEGLALMNATAHKFSDGSYVCANGYRHMPTRAILAPEKLTVSEIDAITDGDLRASVIARYAGPNTTRDEGWMRYLKGVGAKVVHKNKCDVTNTEEVLVESRGTSSEEKELRLIVTCPTARMFVIPVPNVGRDQKPIKTCQQAQSWITGGRRLVART